MQTLGVPCSRRRINTMLPSPSPAPPPTIQRRATRLDRDRVHLTAMASIAPKKSNKLLHIPPPPRPYRLQVPPPKSSGVYHCASHHRVHTPLATMAPEPEVQRDAMDRAQGSAGMQHSLPPPASLFPNTSPTEALVKDTPGGRMRHIWDAKLYGVAQEAPPPSPTSVIPLSSFDWASPRLATGDLQGNDIGLMCPRGLARAHPAETMLLQYARDGCPVKVGRQWSKDEVLVEARCGPHISDFVPEAIVMMHAEVEEKVKEGFVEVVYWDSIEHLLETEDWAQLKKYPLAMVPHKSRKLRAILDLSFGIRVFGVEIPSVNEATNIMAPQHSMDNLGSVLPRLIAAVVAAPEDEGGMFFKTRH